MNQKNTDINVQCGKCSDGASSLDSKSLEIFVTKRKCFLCGSNSKRTSSCNGDLEIEAIGVAGIEITETSFHDKGWE